MYAPAPCKCTSPIMTSGDTIEYAPYSFTNGNFIFGSFEISNRKKLKRVNVGLEFLFQILLKYRAIKHRKIIHLLEHFGFRNSKAYRPILYFYFSNVRKRREPTGSKISELWTRTTLYI